MELSSRGNAAFPSAPAQLAACLANLVQSNEATAPSSLPPIFSAPLRRSFHRFRLLRWQFLEVLPFALQLGYVEALHADEFLDELGKFLRDGGVLDRQLFRDYFQWAPDLPRQAELLRDESFLTPYMDVLRRTWTELADSWNTTGLPDMKRAATLWSRHLASAADAASLFPEKLFLRQPAFSEPIQQAARRGALRVIPLWSVAFGFYLPAGEALYVGFAPETVPFMDKLADRSERLSKQFAALSNDTRVHLLFLLHEHVPQTVGDLALQLRLPHPNVSTHLKVLHQAGFVHMERSGVRTLVTRNRAAIEKLKDALQFDP